MIARMLSLMFRPAAWFFRTPWLALFRVFAFSWVGAAVLLEVVAANMSSLALWRVLAGAAFVAAGAVSAAWAASHHAARKWVGYLGEGLLFAVVVGFFVPPLWWTVPLMVAGAVLVELHGRFAALRPWRILAPLGLPLATLTQRVSAQPRRAGAALRARLARSTRAQRRTDRTFAELVVDLDVNTTHDRH